MDFKNPLSFTGTNVAATTLANLGGSAGSLPGGRLTTESNAPVSVTDRTSQSTIYYTPYVTDYVRLYDGTKVKEYAFTQRSLALSGLTTTSNYDVFLYDNAGTLTLELSAAWTNATTRSNSLAWQTGLGWVKSGTPTRLWLGMIRTTSTTTTEDSGANRFVYNWFNQVTRPAYSGLVYDVHSYSGGTWREWRAGTGSIRLSFVLGSPARVFATISGESVSGGFLGLLLDSTTAMLDQALGEGGSSGSRGAVATQSLVGIGYHQWVPVEYGTGSASLFSYSSIAVLEI